MYISWYVIILDDNETMDAVTIHEHAIRDPLLFGDYRNMIKRKEERYYEDLLDYEAIYFLFQEVSFNQIFVRFNFIIFVWFSVCQSIIFC